MVTGTFGGSDFVHSLLGEASDKLSSASISELNTKISTAQQQSHGSGGGPFGSGGGGGAGGNLMSLLGQIPNFGSGGGSSGFGNVSRDIEEVSRGPAVDPNQMSPQEMYQNLWRILSIRDRVMKGIESTMEKIPGLNSLVDAIGNALSVFIFSMIEPFAKPLIQQALSGLKTGSALVIKDADQFEVFNNPNASDPTHSMLSKDHL